VPRFASLSDESQFGKNIKNFLLNLAKQVPVQRSGSGKIFDPGFSYTYHNTTGPI